MNSILTMNKQWKSIYLELPIDGSSCSCRRSGEEGYVGSCTYDAKTNTFRSYTDFRNRVIITIWKSDEWCYNDS